MATGGDAAAWKHGSVVRVKLKHFLTYDLVEFFPGPRLNVVIGPNGTGKSSIVCAILLGLGGDPKFLGRGDKVADFIQHRQDKATIEVDLHPGSERAETDPPLRLKRRIGRVSAQHKWWINGRSATAQEVKEAVAEFQINPESLCQFLPQDRVGEFSMLSPQALLRQTLDTVCGRAQVEQQDQLARQQQELQARAGEAAAKADKLAQLKEQQAHDQKEVDRISARAEYEAKLELGRTRLVWLEFSEAQARARTLKNERNEAREALAEREEAKGPLDARLQAAEVAELEASGAVRDAKQAAQSAGKKAADAAKQMQLAEDRFFECEGEMSALKRRAQRHGERVRKLEARVAEREEALANAPDPAAAQAEAARLREQLAPARQAERALDGEAKELDRDRRRLHEEIATAQRAGKEAGTAASRAEAAFRARASNAVPILRARDWIAKQNWRGRVHGPVGMCVRTQSPEHAAYLECQVSAKVMGSFVFENADDFELAMRETRGKYRGLMLSVVSPQRHRRPYDDATMRTLKQRFGFAGYLDEVVQAPPAVIQHLQNQSGLASALAGSAATNLQDPELERLLGPNYCVFTPEGRILQKKSRFSSAVSAAERRIEAPKFVQVEDPRLAAEAQAAEEQLRGAEERLRGVERELQAKRLEQQRARQLVAKLRDDIKDAASAGKGRAGLERQLTQARRALEEAREEDDDPEVAAQRLRALMRKYAEKGMRMAAKAAAQLEAAVEAKRVAALASVGKAVAGADRASAHQLRQDLQQAVRELKRTVDQTEAAYKDEMKALKGLHKTAQATAPLQSCGGADGCPCGGDGGSRCPTPVESGLQARWEEAALPDEAQALRSLMYSWEAARDAIAANAEVIARFQQRAKTIEEFEADMAESERTAADERAALDEAAQSWRDTVGALQARVSERFTGMFEELGCHGDVRLEPADPEDFAGWGYTIYVDFRDGSKLAPLSGTRQSGGERSLSTIVYFLSLQALCRAPLRVVDEINQGMDENWERQVYRLVNAHVADQYGPQLFLITPKLLQNLEYHQSNVAVHVVFNGFHLFDEPTAWNFERIMRARAEKRALSAGDDDGPAKRARVAE